MIVVVKAVKGAGWQEREGERKGEEDVEREVLGRKRRGTNERETRYMSLKCIVRSPCQKLRARLCCIKSSLSLLCKTCIALHQTLHLTTSSAKLVQFHLLMSTRL